MKAIDPAYSLVVHGHGCAVRNNETGQQARFETLDTAQWVVEMFREGCDDMGLAWDAPTWLGEHFEVGDVVEIKTTMKNGVDYRTGIITFVDTDLCSYVPFKVDERLESGSGCFKPTAIGTTPYGKTAIKRIGRARISGYDPRFAPKPGDTGYDLMC